MVDDGSAPRYQPVDDSVTGLLRLVGERWTILILRECFVGVRRFSQFAANLGIPRPTLSVRLTRLVAAGLLARERYTDGPVRSDYEYRLTRAGAELFPSLVTLIQWSHANAADPLTDRGSGRTPLAWTHLTCGSPMTPHLTCDHCGGKVDVLNTQSGVATESTH